MGRTGEVRRWSWGSRRGVGTKGNTLTEMGAGIWKEKKGSFIGIARGPYMFRARAGRATLCRIVDSKVPYHRWSEPRHMQGIHQKRLPTCQTTSGRLANYRLHFAPTDRTRRTWTSAFIFYVLSPFPFVSLQNITVLTTGVSHSRSRPFRSGSSLSRCLKCIHGWLQAST
jgi:hypothetical protein